MGIIIKELPGMRAACYRVIWRAPEDDCWAHIKAWAEKNGVFESNYRIFGFNNPNPGEMKKLLDKNGQAYFVADNNPEYGYEFFITVNEDVLPETGRGVEIKTVKGGRFAVMSIGVGCELHDIEKGWGKFNRLLKDGGYQTTGRWFEEHLEFAAVPDPDHFRMDLYVEIESN